jgi:hypothetical protein
MNGLSLRNGDSTPQSTTNAKQNSYYNEPSKSVVPPPAYGATPVPPPAPVAPILTHAVALYAYNATDAGDLSLQQHDRIAVSEYMNAEWWKGRNERTGQEGIFPRSYVRVEEKNMPPQPSTYGNMPVDVAQGAAPGAEDPKKKGMAGKIGGKLGNAAIFGAGGKSLTIHVQCRHMLTLVIATIGGNIVNSIF